MNDIAVVTDKNAAETKVHHWVAEASDLRIPPGKLPTQLTTDLGNCQPFLLVDWDVARMFYRQGNGCLELVVFLD